METLKIAVSFATLIISLATWSLGAFAGWTAWNTYKNAVRWKQLELAGQYLKELKTDEVLLFACLSLDWDVGTLVVPESLQPIVGGNKSSPKVIEHTKRDKLKQAMVVDPHIDATQGAWDATQSGEFQVYRTAMDSLLSWLQLVRQALESEVFKRQDIELVAAWWVFRIEEILPDLEKYMITFGYYGDFIALRHKFGTSIDKFLQAGIQPDIVSS